MSGWRSTRALAGPLALHVSHREEPFGSPLVSTAVAILRRRYTDDAISSLFALPQAHAQGHGCIVGLVDVEATWPADLFNEIEQAQLTEQAIFPVGGTFITQLRNPRWLKYPVRAARRRARRRRRRTRSRRRRLPAPCGGRRGAAGEPRRRRAASAADQLAR